MPDQTPLEKEVEEFKQFLNFKWGHGEGLLIGEKELLNYFKQALTSARLNERKKVIEEIALEVKKAKDELCEHSVTGKEYLEGIIEGRNLSYDKVLTLLKKMKS